MKVNSELITLEAPVCLAEFLKHSGYQSHRVAVELNGRIIPKAQFDTVMLTDADTLEIVCFVGGG